jgi:lipopolysaccharide cholinephosphotransferase
MIDAKIQSQLRERFNPDGSMLRRQQLRMLEILLHIDRVCAEHNIKYWLSSGTLLGAVRHGGFIPWDDDLDIEMLREDYERFVKVFSVSEDYVLQTRKTERYYMLPFAKVRDRHTRLDELGNNVNFKHKGLFVDIFCLERSPRFAYVVFGVAMHILLRVQRGHSGGFARAIALLSKSLFYGSVAIMRPLLRLLPFKSLNHLYGCGPRWRCRHIEDIMPLATVEFEGYSFPAPRDTDAYLRQMFGNYNALPNLEKLRIHNVSCRFLNDENSEE